MVEEAEEEEEEERGWSILKEEEAELWSMASWAR